MSREPTNPQKKGFWVKTKLGIKPERTAEFAIIEKAVTRSIKEYGEALKRLAEND